MSLDSAQQHSIDKMPLRQNAAEKTCPAVPCNLWTKSGVLEC